MNELRVLRRVFAAQLRTRGLVAAAVTAAILLAFGLITANVTAWWFDALPWLRPTSSWIKSQDSWDLFIYVFIGVNLIAYAQQLSSVFLDRHNGHILVRLSEEELAAALLASKDRGLTKPSALLGARRRALESLFRADPALYSLVTLVVSLVILGHFISAVVMVGFGTLVVLYFPRMVAQFFALKEPPEGDDPNSDDANSPDAESLDEPAAPSLPSDIEQPASSAESLTLDEQRARKKAWREKRAANQANAEARREARAARARERAEARLSLSAERMFIIINRPLVRLRIAWPILVGGLVAVASVATLIIHDMSAAGELPQRATLLILLLVLVSRSCITLAQYWEDLAFFAASLSLINESESGKEAL